MATLDPKTPVLVGAAVVAQRLEDPQSALEPAELMIAALERAAADAGSSDLLRKANSIRVPRGFWDYADPGRLIASRVGADTARTQLAEVGVLQTTPFGQAVEAIAAGAEDVVLIAGGEAKYRALRAQLAGSDASLTKQEGAEPDSVLRPHAEIISPHEMNSGLVMPVTQYAVMENALRYAEGKGLDEHRREVAELWAEFSRVAAGNPDAWNREPVSADEIAAPVSGNRMLAFPYTKLHNSQWNVDQAAGLILCSVQAARAAGVPENKWVFPLAVAESNHMVPVSERVELHRSHGFCIAGQRAVEVAGVRIDEVEHVELYSCFPIAVRVQMRELAVPAGRPVTVTGGMAFAGGPLNNFVLQAMVHMVQVLRQDPGSTGMVTAVSGMLTKQGVSLWSTRPPANACRPIDVTREVQAATRRADIVADYVGDASVASCTVVYTADVPSRGIFVCDLPDGRRTLAETHDPQLAAAMTTEEFCGRRVRIGKGKIASVATDN
jgi:acetyl-CoA C-acetyltransferase